MSVICRNCGAILDDRDIFCTECGSPVGDEVSPFLDDDDMDSYGVEDTAGLMERTDEELIRCPECGQMMQPEMDYCINCGAPLKGEMPDYDSTVASDHERGGYESYPSYPDDYPRVPEPDYEPEGDFVGPDTSHDYDADYEPGYDRDYDSGYRDDGRGYGREEVRDFSGEWSDPAFAAPAPEPAKAEAPKPKPALKGSLVKGFERKHKADEGEYEKSEYFTKAGDL